MAQDIRCGRDLRLSGLPFQKMLQLADPGSAKDNASSCMPGCSVTRHSGGGSSPGGHDAQLLVQHVERAQERWSLLRHLEPTGYDTRRRLLPSPSEICDFFEITTSTARAPNTRNS